MRIVSQAEAVQQLPSLLCEVENETVAIAGDGVPLAYVISPAQYATTREAKTRHLLEAMDDLSKEINQRAQADGLDLNDLMRSLDRKAR